MTTRITAVLCEGCGRLAPRSNEVCVFCGHPLAHQDPPVYSETPEVAYYESPAA